MLAEPAAAECLTAHVSWRRKTSGQQQELTWSCGLQQPRLTLWLNSFLASSVFPLPFHDFCQIQFPVQNGLAEAQLHRSGGAVCPSSCSTAVVFPVLRISFVPNYLPIPFPVSEECSWICD